MSDEYWDLIAAGRYDDALRFALANTPDGDWFVAVGGRDSYVRHAWENHVADAKDSRTDHRLKLADRRQMSSALGEAVEHGAQGDPATLLGSSGMKHSTVSPGVLQEECE